MSAAAAATFASPRVPSSGVLFAAFGLGRLKAIVGDAPGFSVTKFDRVLRELHARCEREHGVHSRIGQFLLSAERP